MRDLVLRKAVYADIDLLYLWANDKDVRYNSFSPGTISEEEHKAWFERVMNDPNEIQYIMIKDSLPIGQIRLTVHGQSAEIDYSISNKYRNKGYGKEMLRLVKDKIMGDRPDIKKLTAKVKPDNESSYACFLSGNFVEKYRCFEYMLVANEGGEAEKRQETL